MKLKNLIPACYRTRLIRRFGRAGLVRLPDGRHQLIGGTGADRAAAHEWVSLFAHEIVFTHCPQETPQGNLLGMGGFRPAGARGGRPVDLGIGYA